jgi:hypothetical protein
MRIGYVIKIAAVLVGLAALGSLVLVFRWRLGTQSALAIAAAVLCAILAISAFIAWSWLFQARAKSIVQKWAAEHGFIVLQFESPFHTGAFNFWTTSRGQVVYSVTIRDGAGCERKAWVRCGSYIGSVPFSDEIEVRWQDEPKAA